MQLYRWIDEHLAERLPAFLADQRWFGGKARAIAAAACDDVVPITGAPIPLALVFVRVAFVDGGSDRYAMLIGAAEDATPGQAIGRIDASRWAVEASTQPGAALALIRSLGAVDHQPTRGGGVVRRHDIGTDVIGALTGLSDAHEFRALGAEQSNTSLRVDRRWVFKLIRKLEAGENLELEVGRFLGRTAFHGAPRLRGAWTYVAADQWTSTIAVLQDWVANQGDGWNDVLHELGRGDVDAVASLLQDLRGLGTVTADLHGALAADASVPAFQPITATDTLVHSWQADLADRVARTVAMLGETPPARAAARAMASRVAAAETQLLRCDAPGVHDAGTSFDTIRIHGDYHLGQVLKTVDGYVIIDFEGEPARPIAERRRRHAAMKDVAGMLRSFDYAVETARAHGIAAASTDLLPAMRQTFLDGYVGRAAAVGARFIPRDRAAFDAWVAFFELDKALYEVEYELNHRPDWVHIPLGGVLRVLGQP